VANKTTPDRTILLQDTVDGGGCAHEAILAHIAHQVLQVGMKRHLIGSSLSFVNRLIQNLPCTYTRQGLVFLHDRRQIHRDIKPANLLINHKGQVKIRCAGLIGVDAMWRSLSLN